MGRVKNGIMSHVVPTNAKLRQRKLRIIRNYNYLLEIKLKFKILVKIHHFNNFKFVLILL